MSNAQVPQVEHLQVPEVYARLGIKPVINAQSWVTVLGGSLMPPEVLRAMDEAAKCFVHMRELNIAAGKVVARACGAEAGLVTAGAAAAQVLMVAACMTGNDPAKIEQLPDTTGMKTEVVMFRGHRNRYDGAFMIPGAKIVEYGFGRSATDYQLHAAITENTCCVAYVFAPFLVHPMPLEQVVEIAHSRGVPVIVDAAAEAPPAENLTKFIRQGADLVTFSGGKGIRGPQSTGLLAGKKELVEAAFENSLNLDSTHAGIGRPMKVSKENIIGLVAALELFMNTDHDAVWAQWRAQAQHIVDRLQGIPGLRVVLEDHDPNRQGPQAVIYFEYDWKGPSPAEVRAKLLEEEPPIYVGVGGYKDEINVVMTNVQPGEEKIIADRLLQILT